MLCLVAQSCPTLCDPMDCSPLCSSVHGILQAIILNGLPLASPWDHPDPRIEPGSPALQAASLPSEPPGKPLFSSKGLSILSFILTVDSPLCPLSQEGLRTGNSTQSQHRTFPQLSLGSHSPPGEASCTQQQGAPQLTPQSPQATQQALVQPHSEQSSLPSPRV